MGTEKKEAHDLIIDAMRRNISFLTSVKHGSRSAVIFLEIIYDLGNIMKNMIIPDEHKKDVMCRLYSIRNSSNIEKPPVIKALLKEVIKSI